MKAPRNDQRTIDNLFASNRGLSFTALKNYLGAGERRREILKRIGGIDAAKQEAEIGLWMAARHYDTEYATARFSTYAFRCIFSALTSALRKKGHSVLADNLPFLAPSWFGPARSEERSHAVDDVREILPLLRRPDSRLLCAYYLDGKTQEILAHRYHVGRAAVGVRIREALARARTVANRSEADG